MKAILLRGLLFILGSYAIVFEMLFWDEGARASAASLLGLVLSAVSSELLESKVFYWSAAVLYHLGVLLWFVKPKFKLSSIVVALSFLACSSLYIENLVLAQTHLFQPLAYTFIILALKENGVLKKSRYLVASYLCLIFFHSGLQKVFANGTWWDSANIQTIFHYFGKNEMVKEWVLNNSFLAEMVGIVVLLLELSSIAPLLFPRLFPYWGVMQLIFLFCVGISFHWFFYPLAILILGYYWGLEKEGLAHAG